MPGLWRYFLRAGVGSPAETPDVLRFFPMGVRCDDASGGRPFPRPAAEPVDVRAFAFVPAMARGYRRASSTVERKEEGTATGGRLDARATRRSWSAGTRTARVGTGGATMAGRR